MRPGCSLCRRCPRTDPVGQLAVVDLGAISAGIASLKTAADMAKAVADVSTAVGVQGKVFELQRAILAAQQDTFAAQQTQSALLQDKAELEERLRQYERWEVEKTRYRLVEVGAGGFAYTLREDATGNDPQHYICVHCYERGRKSVLTKVHIPAGRAKMLRCQPCGAEIITEGVDMRPDSASGTKGFRPLS